MAGEIQTSIPKAKVAISGVVKMVCPSLEALNAVHVQVNGTGQKL
jgi:hypothetical protein